MCSRKNQNIVNNISVNNEINESEEDSSIDLLESTYSPSTDDSRFEINSDRSIDSDEVSDILIHKEFLGCLENEALEN